MVSKRNLTIIEWSELPDTTFMSDFGTINSNVKIYDIIDLIDGIRVVIHFGSKTGAMLLKFFFH